MSECCRGELPPIPGRRRRPSHATRKVFQTLGFNVGQGDTRIAVRIDNADLLAATFLTRCRRRFDPGFFPSASLPFG
jgi:hypothetical protein